jgi:signal transduction histidine kinase
MLLCLGWLWLAATGAAAQAQTPTQTPTVVVRAAQAVVSDSAAFPADQDAPLVDLPDAWPDSRPASDGPVWYRLAFTAPGVQDRGELLALFIEHVCSNLQVQLNGQLIHSGGRMRERVTGNCNHPQLVSLPAGLIAPGLNTLDLKVAGLPLQQVASTHRAGGLSALELGPHPVLADKHALQVALNVTVPQALGAALLLLGGYMLAAGWAHRRDRQLAWFGALAVGWAVFDARLWLRQLPFDSTTAELLLCSMLPLLAWAGVQFLLRHAYLRRRWIDIALPLQALLMPATLLLAGPQRLHAVASGWYALLMLQALAAAAFYLRAQYRAGRHAFWPKALLLCAALLALALQYAAQVLGLRGLPLQLAQIAAPALLLLAGLRLLQQHARVPLDDGEGQAQLELRIREATAEIERNFTQLAELRVEKVTERERKRIAADLHDDLGAKLLTIVHTSDSERISTLAREALEEMRLSVRGLTGKPVQLIDALGDWRAEVVLRLGQAGIQADWTAPADDQPQTLSARAFVQTTRILREAISNVIKHSGASHCSLSCDIADGDMQIVVRDNGHGIPLELDGRLDRGHGMASMKHRAKQLQGQCLVESGPGFGTVIRLTLPLNRATELA